MMNALNIPVYTISAECQDCYKCVRECPVKAIKVEENHASIIPELCIHCGHCVSVCPVEAKHVRDDASRVLTWIHLNQKIIVSLAPSWVTEFPTISDTQMIAALKHIGFAIVSETALGAEEVNAHTIKYLKEKKRGIVISSACPTIVQLIQKYYPQYIENILPLDSPLIAHCKMLKKKYGKEYKRVFIGPCFSKKHEADIHPDYLDAAISFIDLKQIFEKNHIDPHNFSGKKSDVFLPQAAEEGRLYPVDGGMLAGICEHCSNTDLHYISISGLNHIKSCIDQLDFHASKNNLLFIEAMACEGGCINGPGSTRSVSFLQKRVELLKQQHTFQKQTMRAEKIDIANDYESSQTTGTSVTEEAIEKVFRSIGKYTKKDQLNCGGCGYNTCRDFAVAIINGKAEKNMCVSYLRKLAQKKANALFRTMPSGVIIVDHDLNIREFNENFFKILNMEREMQLVNCEKITNLVSVVDFSSLFKQVLDTDIDIIDRELIHRDRIVKCSIFVIEKHQFVGAILQDVTQPSVLREQTIKKAQKAIRETLDTAQKIAYLLGENSAEVEMTLNSIVDTFSPEVQNGENTDETLG